MQADGQVSHRTVNAVKRSIAIVLLLTLGLAACGHSAPSTHRDGETKMIDAWSRLTPAQQTTTCHVVAEQGADLVISGVAEIEYQDKADATKALEALCS